MTVRSKGVIGLMVPLALAVVVAGIAWACTPPNVYVSPNWAEQGETVTVSGESFSDVPVEVYLTEDGTVTDASRHLASTHGPQFAVSATIPTDIAEGDYWVIAQYETANGPGKQGVALHVGPPAPDEQEPVEGGGEGSEGRNGGEGTSGRAGDPPQGRSGSRQGDTTDNTSTSTAPVASTVSASAPTRNRDGSKTDNGRAAVPAAPPLEVPRADSFAQGPAPSLVPGEFDVYQGGSPSSNYFLYGVVLLSVAAVTMVSGLGIAVSTRRRAHADSNSN